MGTPRQTIADVLEEKSQDIIGRREERAALLQALEEGGPLVVFVHGIAGVGKSTLVESFVREGRDLGATVVRLDCRSVEPTARGFLLALAEGVGGEFGNADEAAERLAGLADRVVLVLDTYEVLRLVDAWVRQEFVPALRDNTRVVLASREPPVAAWHGSPWSGSLVRSVRLDNLAPAEAEELLRRGGLDVDEAHRVNRLARGHPLSLALAAAAVRARPEVDLEDIAWQAVFDEFTALYLDALEAPTRQALDAASVVRRVTLSLLEAMLPERAPHDSFERLRALPFVQLEREGLVIHDTVREAVAAALRAADPAAYSRHRRAAWQRLRSEVRTAPAAQLWRYTADMLYLIENPVVREAFFPTTEHVFSVEPALPADGPAIEEIVRRHEPDASAEHLLRWWEQAPEGFRVVRDRERVAGFLILFEPNKVPYGAIEADPVTRSWREHLRRAPVPRGQRVLFNRRWLTRNGGEQPSPAQAACWLDIKRVYMEMRPELRRLYGAVRDIATWAPIAAPLGFVPLAGSVQLGEATYHSVVLDFGPASIDGWLATLAATELLIEEESILDPVERQLVLDGRRVDLTRLEFEVLNYLLQRESEVAEREALLRDVWGSTYVGSNVLEAVVRSLRKKLRERAGMIETVRGLGYRLRAEDR